jgi:hypothetical protein
MPPHRLGKHVGEADSDRDGGRRCAGGGLVDDLARPGANRTGLTLVGTELAAKRLELMRRL